MIKAGDSQFWFGASLLIVGVFRPGADSTGSISHRTTAKNPTLGTLTLEITTILSLGNGTT